MFRRQKKEILCSEPLVSVIKGFMSHSDCDELIKFVADDLRKSKETHFDGITTVTTARTGSEKVISDEKCGANKRQRRALSKLIDIKKCFFEHSVIINYKDGQQYKPHFDQGEGLEYKRLATAICYLNDVEEGGETEFLHQSVRVQPKRGRIVIWPAGFPYLHRGNPPLAGEKYILTSWMMLR